MSVLLLLVWVGCNSGVTHDTGGAPDDSSADDTGQDDLLVASGRIEINGLAGSVYPGVSNSDWVFYGPLDEGTVQAADADLIFQDDEHNYFGVQARVAGDTNGDGTAELLVGGESRYLYLIDITAAGSY